MSALAIGGRGVLVASSGPRAEHRASSAAVWPRAPHSAIRSALATLAGEKTVSAASSVRIWYRSAPSAASAAAGTFRTVRTYPPRMKAWPDELVHDRGYQTVPERGGGVPARRPGQEHGDPDRDRGPQGQGGRLGRGRCSAGGNRKESRSGPRSCTRRTSPPALRGERPGRCAWPGISPRLAAGSPASTPARRRPTRSRRPGGTAPGPRPRCTAGGGGGGARGCCGDFRGRDARRLRHLRPGDGRGTPGRRAGLPGPDLAARLSARGHRTAQPHPSGWPGDRVPGA